MYTCGCTCKIVKNKGHRGRVCKQSFGKYARAFLSNFESKSNGATDIDELIINADLTPWYPFPYESILNRWYNYHTYHIIIIFFYYYTNTFI